MTRNIVFSAWNLRLYRMTFNDLYFIHKNVKYYIYKPDCLCIYDPSLTTIFKSNEKQIYFLINHNHQYNYI